MILTDWLEKIKHNERPLIWLGFLLLTNLLAFGFGRLTILVGEPEPITVDFAPQTTEVTPREVVQARTEVSPQGSPRSDLGTIVASKNGTKYPLPNCPGAKQIKESNKIFFASVDEATRAGYTPAANCPGLK